MDALGGFDPQAAYNDASKDYEDASRDYWQYLAVRTVDRLDLQPGERVLDLACGNGPGLIPAARRVGPDGVVVGVDYAEQMLDIARAKIAQEGVDNVQLEVGDFTQLAAPAVPYDALMCVLGLFFVEDMAGTLRSFLDQLRPGGRLCITVLGEHFYIPMEEVFVEAVAQAAPGTEVVLPWRRLRDPDVLRSVFDEAGLPGVRIETDDATMTLSSPEEWWRIVMGSGLRRTVAAIGPEKAAEVRAFCDAYMTDHDIRDVVLRSRYALAERP